MGVRGVLESARQERFSWGHTSVPWGPHGPWPLLSFYPDPDGDGSGL